MKNFVFMVAMVMMIGCGTGINGNDVYDAEDIIETEDAVKLDVMPSDGEVNDEGTDVATDTFDIIDNDVEDVMPSDGEVNDEGTDVADDDSVDIPIVITECEDGQVVFEDACCTPMCVDGQECGEDGCGGFCGECSNAANGVEKACQEGMCVCEMFKPIANDYVPEADGSGKKIYMNCVENIITCVYANGDAVDYNDPSILLPNSSTIFIDLLQGEASCENNLTQWSNWDSYYVVNNNTTCEFEFDEIQLPKPLNFLK